MKEHLPLITAIATIVGLFIAIWAGIPAWRQHQSKTFINNGSIEIQSSQTGTPSQPRPSSPPGISGATPVSASNETAISRDMPVKMQIDYEDLKTRFDAVELSLHRRFNDLGGVGPKPEILSGLEKCRKDLEAASLAIKEKNKEVVAARLENAKDTLKYLESL
jgi:hypothetical protein